jgi:hypothetical protein
VHQGCRAPTRILLSIIIYAMNRTLGGPLLLKETLSNAIANSSYFQNYILLCNSFVIVIFFVVVWELFFSLNSEERKIERFVTELIYEVTL